MVKYATFGGKVLIAGIDLKVLLTVLSYKTVGSHLNRSK
jgi:hypothetical protein